VLIREYMDAEAFEHPTLGRVGLHVMHRRI
jgi:hypothetical protein